MLNIEKQNNSEHEIKFIFPNCRVDPVIQWLNHICRPDPDFPIGIVSSIYYDTKAWHFLREKINSDYLKTKVRLRWYENNSKEQEKYSDISFAEIKYKIGARREKIRIETPYSATWLSRVNLYDETLLKIPYLIQSKNIILHKNIFPAFLIRYERRRFIEPTNGVRVCIDYNISTPKVNKIFLPDAKPGQLNTAVFEVKGGVNGLPCILHNLTDMGFKKSAFSKYSACYQKIRRVYF